MLKSRLEFCQKYKDMPESFWENVIFADESYIQVNPNAIINRIRRFKTDNCLSRNFVKKTTKFPYKIMIWGCLNAKKLEDMKYA